MSIFDDANKLTKLNSGDSHVSGEPEDKVHQRWTLRKRSEIPLHLRFNRFVLFHYRPLTDWKGCIKSLFYLHNETVNVLTHAVPIFAILFSLDIIFPWAQINVPFLPWIHIASCTAPWVGSTIYHLFMNHESGYPTYKALLLLDMLGIWIAQNPGTITPLMSTLYCYNWETKLLCFSLFGAAAMMSLYKAITARCPWQRRYSFTLPFIFRVILVGLRVLGFGGGSHEAVHHLVIQDIMAIAGALIGVLNVPERWLPGKFDLIFNSHHLMHVMVVYAAYQMHQAVTLDLIWMTDVDNGNVKCF